MGLYGSLHMGKHRRELDAAGIAAAESLLRPPPGGIPTVRDVTVGYNIQVDCLSEAGVKAPALLPAWQTIACDALSRN